MLSKNDYRAFFAKCRLMLKMKYFLNLANISQATFSKFMKSEENNWLLSVKALDRLYRVIQEEINFIV